MANADTVRQFSIGLDKWAEKSQSLARQKFISVSLEAAYMLRDLSPVDTGFFRSMWGVVIGELPALTPVNRPDGFTGTGQSAFEAQLSDIQNMDISRTVWIVNPTVYGPSLEHGHSKQAPAGMVGLTAQAIQNKYPVKR